MVSSVCTHQTTIHKGAVYQPKADQVPERFRPDWIEAMDGRLATVKIVRARLAALLSDLGGAESLSYQEGAIARRLVWLEALCEKVESEIAEGKDADVNRYTQQVNTLIGVAKALGLKRRAKDALSLGDYLAARAEAAESTPDASEGEPMPEAAT